MEVLLASAIGMLVLYGVYLAIDTQLRFAENGRNLIEEATLARSLTARITSDIAPCVGQPDPGRYRSQNASQASTTTPMADSTNGTGDMSGSGTDLVRAFAGTETTLNVFVSRVPRFAASGTSGMSVMGPGAPNVNQIDSDQKLIIYWLAGGTGSQPLGLARYEMPLSTAAADGLPNLVGGADEAKYVIAPEVVSLSFRYFDGISWDIGWTGSNKGSDDKTPLGPPMAVEVKFELETPGVRGEPARRRPFRHVIAIPTANGKTQTNDSQPPPEQP